MAQPLSASTNCTDVTCIPEYWIDDDPPPSVVATIRPFWSTHHPWSASTNWMGPEGCGGNARGDVTGVPGVVVVEPVVEPPVGVAAGCCVAPVPRKARAAPV